MNKRNIDDTVMVRLEVGDLVKEKNGRKDIGTILKYILVPNGVNDKSLVCMIKVEFNSGRTLIASSDKFEPVPDTMYTEQYTLLM